MALLGGLLLTLVLASIANTWILYRSLRAEMDALLGERLLSIATTVVGSIDSARFAELSVLGPESSDYETARAELEAIAAANDLDNIILIDVDYITVLDLRGPADFGEEHPLLKLQPELLGTLVSGIPQSSPLVQVEVAGLPREFLKTGFAPIEDGSGLILGAIAVEGGSGFFAVLPKMRDQILFSVIWGLAAVVILGLLFYRVLRSLSHLEDSMRRTAALAAIGQISAVVAHEIKNPLAIIRSRAERVRSKILSGKDSKEVLEWFETIPSEIDRLNEIVTNYLSLARPDQSGEGRCRVRPVVEETLRLLGPDLEKQGIDVRLDISESEAVELPIGARSLKQLLLNLILNAAQAMSESNSESESKRGEIVIAARQSSSWVEIEITDTGPGMSEDQRGRVLEPFFTTKATGSGLGLTLVSSLVQGRGGRLEIDSSPGKGTRVRARFPE